MKKNAWMLGICLAVASALGSNTLPAQAQVSVHVRIGPPPPPRHERIPRLPPGYVWAPGYWQLHGNRYVWRPGHQMRGRPGQHWRAPHWVHGRHGWEMRQGGWDRNHGHPKNRIHGCPPGRRC
ncbi:MULTISPECIES: YXWGXW repeat-containing protein [Ralstonia]|uniref:YXWGXW repeat-containing protein n=2 Tax=Burkholderiaceae TaxID=119060 RepID=UPI0009B98354|nr:YXWGXW repeat-containing protein [Ralstonia insidiosa]